MKTVVEEFIEEMREMEQATGNTNQYRRQFEEIVKAAIDFGEQIGRYNPASAEEAKTCVIELHSRAVEAMANRQIIDIIRFCQANHTSQWFQQVDPRDIMNEFNFRLKERNEIKVIPDQFRVYPLTPDECFKKSEKSFGDLREKE